MQRKKFTKISVILVSLLFAFASCSNGSSGSSDDEPATTQESASVAEPQRQAYSIYGKFTKPNDIGWFTGTWETKAILMSDKNRTIAVPAFVEAKSYVRFDISESDGLSEDTWQITFIYDGAYCYGDPADYSEQNERFPVKLSGTATVTLSPENPTADVSAPMTIITDNSISQR
jgi:hypothetical protein